MQPMLESVTVAVPLPPAAALIVTVKLAVSVSSTGMLLIVQAAGCPTHEPLVQATKLPPPVPTAFSVTVSVEPTLQLGASVQGTLASLTVAVPSPLAAAVTSGSVISGAARTPAGCCIPLSSGGVPKAVGAHETAPIEGAVTVL